MSRILTAGPALVLIAGAILSGCNSTEKTLASKADTAPVKKQPLVTGAPKVENISTRGGTKIAVLVNGAPLTSSDIKRRASFVKLRRMKGNRTTIATNELIEEAIKMQEAQRLGVIASNAQVDESFLRFATGNRMSPQKLASDLNRNGTTARGFKDYIRAQLSWQNAVGRRLRAEAAGRGPGSKPSGPAWLPAIGTGANREKEYTLQQIVFTVTPAERGKKLAGRKAQARNFRQRMKNCENAKKLAASLNSVAVVDRGRVLQSRLPPDWRKEIIAVGEGGSTKVRVTQRGAEIIAVCRTRDVIGSTTKAQKELFASDKFRSAATSLEKKYFKELKDRAKIVRR